MPYSKNAFARTDFQVSGSQQTGLAEKYVVDDLPGASLVGARLNGILRKIDAGEELTIWSQSFLASRGLLALRALATGQMDDCGFRELAARERAERIRKAKSRADEEAEEQARQSEAIDAAIKAGFAAIDNRPISRRRSEASELRDYFDIGFIEPEHYPRVLRLLKQVHSGRRPPPEDIAWLSTVASYCWTEGLQRAWHRVEAEALTKKWEKSGDVWDAVNASGHWRKAKKPERALEVTEEALSVAGQSPKLRSALLTTRGGAMRDVRRLAEARALGLEAHDLTPTDFRPCTLPGAVYMELGEFATGHEWYIRAESLGAERGAIDQDLRALLIRSGRDARDLIRKYLLEHDPERFAWLRKWKFRAGTPGKGNRAR